MKDTLSPSPNDQTLSPIQVDPTPSPSPINFDPTPSPHEDEVNNVEAQRGICRLKSKIWQHFKKLKSMVWTRLNASIVRNFLVGNQKIEPNFMREMKGHTFLTPKVVQGKQKLGARTYEAKSASGELKKAIIMHEYALSIVDHLGFMRYFGALQPSGHYIKHVDFNQLEEGVFIYVLAPHTSDRFCNNIDTKLSTITLDNCTTNDVIIDKIKDKFHLGSFLKDGSLLHMRCCAHILNLIVKDGLEDSVAYWTITTKRKGKFEETTKQLRIPYTKNLALDCPTRWNSTYKMLEIVIGTLQWKFAKDVCGRLKLFNTITELFSSTKHPSANLYFPNICEIKLPIKRWITSSNPIIQQMEKI
ncbi:putative AC transposase [Glycine soja]